MKKIIKILIAFAGVVVLILSLAAIFNICPPRGPWVMPPWCEINKPSPQQAMVPANSGVVSETGKESKTVNDESGKIGGKSKSDSMEIVKTAGRFKADGDGAGGAKGDGINSEFTYSALRYIPKTTDEVSKNFIFGVGMMDVWGIICDFSSCDNMEDNREYVNSSFRRLKQLNSGLVMVTDFYQIDRNKNISEVGGGARTISSEEMKMLIKAAHKNNMKFMLMTNLYEKNNSREVLDMQNPSKQEIDKLFSGWKEKILIQAKKGGYDYLVINPRDIAFFFSKDKDNDYINSKLVELIPWIRKVYSGGICLWGTKGWIKNFGEKYDCIIVDEGIKDIFNGTPENLSSITNKWDYYLNSINYSKPTFVLILMPSYKGALENGWIEPIGKKYSDEYIKDYKIQAMVYEGFFRAAVKHPKISGVISYGYWWNDRVYPNTLNIFRNDLSHSIRDKDAESVFYGWSEGAK